MKTTSSSVLILGGTSAVGMAYARECAKSGCRIILAGRNKKTLSENCTDLSARGAETVDSLVMDLGDPKTVSKNWESIMALSGDIDRIFLVYGVLGNQADSQNDVETLHTELSVNFTSAAMWCEKAFSLFHKNGEGQLTVVSSVAGDRGRQSNYHYGAAKGGLSIFLNGMMHRAALIKEAKINILLVKPGFIDTPMTDHLDKSGPLWASPEKIARIILSSEKKGKRVVYAPWFWRFILLIITHVPFFVFKRTSL